jgi:hypothetical protein
MKTIILNDEDFERLISLFDKEIGDLKLNAEELKCTGRSHFAQTFLDGAKRLEELKNKIMEQKNS